jgi:hypothetical protein
MRRWSTGAFDTAYGFKTLLALCTFAVDSGAKPILLSATMKTALILVVGKRVGKAV